MTDELTPLYILVGTIVVGQVARSGVDLFKWLGQRTVAREDKDKDELRASIKAHESRFEEQDQFIQTLDKTVSSLQHELRQVLNSLESIRGGVSEVKVALETRFEKQSEFYRGQLKEVLGNVTEKLEKMEYDVRQEITRAMRDAQALSNKRRK